MYYGQLAIMPFILHQASKSFSSYLFTILGEAPTILLSYFLIDVPFMGRKNSLILFYLLGTLFHYGSYKIDQNHL